MAKRNDRLISTEELSRLFNKDEDELFDLISNENLSFVQVENKTFVDREKVCNWILDNRISSECYLSDGRKIILEPVRLIKTDENIFFFYITFPDTEEGIFFEVHLSKEGFRETPDLIYVYSRLKEAITEKESLTSSYVVISTDQVTFSEIVPEIEL